MYCLKLKASAEIFIYSVIKIHILPEVYLGLHNIEDGAHCDIPMGIYQLKFNNRNIRTSCKIYLKSTIKTPVEKFYFWENQVSPGRDLIVGIHRWGAVRVPKLV